MITLLFGIAALLVVLWALNVFAKTDPQMVIRYAKTAGGAGAVIGAVFLAVIGRFGLAVPLGVAGLVLLGFLPSSVLFGRHAARSARQTSRVRSSFLDMELDHDSGAMTGRVLAGGYKGTPLDALDRETLIGLLSEIDEESRALLASYLDRRHPGWREHAQADPAAGHVDTPRTGPMTEQEAYQILGLKPGAGTADISQAHRTLMKKLHPDQGGSTYLAARINEAKDVLLRRHR